MQAPQRNSHFDAAAMSVNTVRGVLAVLAVLACVQSWRLISSYEAAHHRSASSSLPASPYTRRSPLVEPPQPCAQHVPAHVSPH